jgi:hypothetical protein
MNGAPAPIGGFTRWSNHGHGGLLLAKAVLSIANIFDLDQLYLAGPGFAETGEIYLGVVRDYLDRLAFMRAVHPVKVELSDTSPESGALGAASVVLHSHLTPHHASARG